MPLFLVDYTATIEIKSKRSKGTNFSTTFKDSQLVKADRFEEVVTKIRIVIEGKYKTGTLKKLKIKNKTLE